MTRAVVAGAMMILLAFASWRDSSTVAQALGIVDKPSPPQIVIDILCDPSAGSTCTSSTLRSTIGDGLNVAVTRPGSVVRLWMQGHTIETTAMIAGVVSPATKRSGKRARQHSAEKWISASANTLLKAATPFLLKRYRRSPIAESITRVALATPPASMRRVIVVVGDGLEVSAFGDFECGRLPSVKRFLRDLHRAQVLPERSLSGIDVEFCEVQISPIDRKRCALTLRRVAGVEELWRNAMTSAGAAKFTIRHGGTHLQTMKQEVER